MSDDVFFCSTILDWIKEQKTAKNETKSVFFDKKTNVNLTIWSFKNLESNDKKNSKTISKNVKKDEKEKQNKIIENLSKLIFFLVKWVRNLNHSKYNRKKKPKWEIEIFLTPFNLKWCTTESSIGICNVNSGETEFFENGTLKIRVWRTESLLRTVIHELLHAHLWDRFVEHFLRIENFKRNDSESFIETCSRMLYCCFLSSNPFLLKQKNQKNEKEKNNDELELLKKEKEHATKLARFLYDQKQSWDSTTNVMPYYFYTATLLDNQELFCGWLDNWPNISWVQMRDQCYLNFFKAPIHSQNSESINKNKSKPESCSSFKMVYHQIDLQSLETHSSFS